RAAGGAAHLGAAHAVRDVVFVGDRLLGDGLVVRRPAAARVVLGARAEQRGVAADAAVEAIAFVVPVDPREGGLGAPLSGDPELLLGQLLAPLGIALVDLRHDAQSTACAPPK